MEKLNNESTGTDNSEKEPGLEELVKLIVAENPHQVIYKEPELQLKDRWSYRMAKREFRKEAKDYVRQQNLNLIEKLPPEMRFKGYENFNRTSLRKLAMKLLFLGFMSWLAPTALPELIKNLLS